MTDPHAGQPVLMAGAPLGEGAATVIMLHGRGAGPRDILALAAALERPEHTYLAPSAADGTWYPYSFLTEISKNEPHLSSALRVVRSLVDATIARGIDRRRVVLAGFSQGACLACESSIRDAGRYGGVIGFSGGAIGPPGTSWNYSGSFDGTPVFLG
jgi:predicted esterase